MKSKFILFIAGWMVMTCSTKTTDSKLDPDFEKFVALLPQIKLPYDVSCEKCCDHPDVDYDNEFLNKYQPDGSAVVGLIGMSGDKVAILVTYPADMIIPAVVVYDPSGKVLSNKAFMTSACGRDMYGDYHQHFRIISHMAFTEFDTSYSFNIDTIRFDVIDTSKVEISTNDFIIDSVGRIVEKN